VALLAIITFAGILFLGATAMMAIIAERIDTAVTVGATVFSGESFGYLLEGIDGFLGLRFGERADAVICLLGESSGRDGQDCGEA
jgi:hypothetical protein